MGATPRMTLATLQVLSILVDDVRAKHYGLELSKRAGFKPGTIYPILARLEEAGWVTSAWEDIDPAIEGRPLRRYYQLSLDGAERARRALTDAQRSLALSTRAR
jgi:PadR family transcriptional regulator, regulatory protein PadR